MTQAATSTSPVLDLRLLETFVAVVEGAGMVGAAKQLHVTQPAVSKSISQLEKQLGLALIDRSQRPLRPTRAGQLLYRSATSLLKEAQNIPNLLSMAAHDTMPRIRVGLVESFTATGAPFVKAMQAMAQEVRISCSLTPELARGLKQWELDFVITSDMMEDESGLVRSTLMEEPFILVQPRNSDPVGDLDSLRQLPARTPFIRYTNRSMIGRTIDRYLSRARVPTSNTLEFDTSTPLLQMVIAELGWAVTTPLCLLQSQADRSSLRISALPGAPTRKLYLVHRSGDLGELPERIFLLASNLLESLIARSFGQGDERILALIRFAEPTRD